MINTCICGSAGHLHQQLTAMYDLVPTNELAIELISWPLTPKSHNLISPRELTSTLDGFTSETMYNTVNNCAAKNHIITSMNDFMILS